MRVVVVGAGVVGLTAASLAAAAGHQVTLVEPSPLDPGSASVNNAGVLHVLQPPPGRRRILYAPRGARVSAEIARLLGAPMLETRLLLYASPGLRSRTLLGLARAWLRAVAPWAGSRVVRAAEARRLEPLFAPREGSVLVVEPYRVVHPRGLLDRLWGEATGRLGVVHARARATGVSCRGGLVTVRLGTGEEIGAQAVINAAGPGAPSLASGHGVRIAVRLVLGVMELYRRPRPESIVARLPTGLRAESKGGAIIPWPTGYTLYGPSFHPGGDAPPPGGVAKAYAGLLEEDPSGPPARVLRGYRTVARPRDFHIVRPRACPGVVHLLGIESPGLTAAPLLAERALRLAGAAASVEDLLRALRA